MDIALTSANVFSAESMAGLTALRSHIAQLSSSMPRVATMIPKAVHLSAAAAQLQVLQLHSYQTMSLASGTQIGTSLGLGTAVAAKKVYGLLNLAWAEANMLYSQAGCLSAQQAVMPLIVFYIAHKSYKFVQRQADPTRALTLAGVLDAVRSDIKAMHTSVRTQLTSKVSEIAASKENRKAGLTYLERLFKSKDVHESLLVLLKGGVKDGRFVEDSKHFGAAWIAKSVTQPESKEALKELVSETFVKERRVQAQAIEVVKYFVSQPETKELARQICQAACLQPETKQAAVGQLQIGGTTAVQTNEVRTAMSKNLALSLSEERVAAELKAVLLFRPLANTLTFGLYSRLAGASAPLFMETA